MKLTEGLLTLGGAALCLSILVNVNSNNGNDNSQDHDHYYAPKNEPAADQVSGLKGDDLRTGAKHYAPKETQIEGLNGIQVTD